MAAGDDTDNPRMVEKSAIEEFPLDEAGSGECRQILRDLLPKLKERAGKEAGEYSSLVWEAVSDLRLIQDALWQNVGAIDDSEKKYAPGTLWAWPSQEALQRPPSNWHDRSPANMDSLDRALVGYLQCPWLQHNLVDVSAINAFIFTELAIALEDVRTGAALGVPNLSYIFSGGNVFAQLGLAVCGRIVGFLLRWVMLPAIALGLLAYNYETGALVTIGLWALYLLYRVIMVPARWKARGARKAAAKKADEIIAAMLKAWHAARHSTLNPTRLKELVVAAEGHGILYRPVLHTLLDRAIQRDPAALTRR
ncbi:hypothetical protein HNQ96_001434 [Aminobacter lissarensis]|uniref:Uncharacterized protein n=1 Tax=Aminobacter carboxidus TaxID=376165 RepID=A0A8E2BAJ2_9HYPH|nr:hypothetical protein [Aminobacter lissarensis]MBB6465576.1 hypothetical protein [Aminobacter lissarensis]